MSKVQKVEKLPRSGQYAKRVVVGKAHAPARHGVSYSSVTITERKTPKR